MTVSLSNQLLPYYGLIKSTHLSLVACSVSFFLVRALASQAGQTWPLRVIARRLSVLVDALLLTAGLSLWWLLGLNPTVQYWLGLKLALLLGYIVAGSVAIKRGRNLRQRRLALALALSLVSLMAVVAHRHSVWPF